MSRKQQSTYESNVTPTKPIRLHKTIIRHSPKKKHVTRVGETGNFAVDYDSVERLVLLFGKEAQTSHGIKLGLDKNEVTAVTRLLRQAKTLFNSPRS